MFGVGFDLSYDGDGELFDFVVCYEFDLGDGLCCLFSDWGVD